MSYKSFTFKQLKQQFGLQQSISSIFPTADIIPLEPSEWLRRTLEIASNTALTTEKERSERIISPILLESREKNNREFSIFSGSIFDVDISQGLNGECDFLAENNLTIDADIYYLDNVQVILGVLQIIVDLYQNR